MHFSKFLSAPFFLGLFLGGVMTAASADMLGSAVFSDIPRGAYYDAAVGRLNSQGIFRGAGDGKFHPGDFVNRADMAVLLDRALNGGGGGGTTVSSRSSRSSSSREASSSSSSSSSAVIITGAGAFRFSLDKVAFPESASNVSVAVQRYSGTEGAASVRYTTADGTAKSGVRYNQNTGVLNFAPGETSKVVSLKFINNLIAEPNETFTISLSETTGGAVVGTPGTLVVTVLDNDGGGGNSTAGSASSSSATASSVANAPGGNINFSAWAYAVDESAGAITINVLRKGSTSSAVAVNYATSDGTATSGSNYAATQGTLNFAAGESSKTFSVQVTHLNSIDGNKSANLTLSNATGGASLDAPNKVSLVIVDTEAGASATGSIMFSDATFSASQKSDKSKVITVYRRGGYNSTVTVNYSTRDGTAVGGVDYTPQSGTLTFAPGESSKSFTVPIVATTFTGDKFVNLDLTTITGPAVASAQMQAQLKIFGQ